MVDAINSLGHISVFTLMDGQAVAEGEEVAGCKVTPVAVAGSVIERAERLCQEAGPVIDLVAFRPLKTFVVATERLKPKARELFRAAVTAKLGWYGAEVVAVREVARTDEAVAAAYREALDGGAQPGGKPTFKSKPIPGTSLTCSSGSHDLPPSVEELYHVWNSRFCGSSRLSSQSACSRPSLSALRTGVMWSATTFVGSWLSVVAGDQVAP